jgi:hypothetical protein
MKIIIGMATMKGREKEVHKAIKSLYENTVKPDDLILWDNTKGEDLTDNGKFYGLSKYKHEPIIYLTCDDDLIYPKNYIEKCIKELKLHNCIISFHGRKLLGEGRDYYRQHKAFGCLQHYPQTAQIDVAGTGVTAFRTDYFNPIDLHKAEDKKMSDLVFALEAAKFNKKIMHIGHMGKWIIQQPIEKEKTIYGMENKNCERQNEIADEIYRIKNNLIRK